MMQGLTRSAVVLVCVLALFVPGSAVTAQPQTVKIASLTSQTGPNAMIGEQWRLGVKMAVDEINEAGGIKSLGGAKLVIVEGDTQSKPEIAAAETERAIRDGVAAIMAGIESSVVIVTTQVAERARVPHMVPLSVSDQILARGFKYSFRIMEGADLATKRNAADLRALADETKTPIKRVAVIHEDSLMGTSIGEGLERHLKELKFDVVGRVSYNNKATDLTPELTKLKALKPDVLAMNSYYNDSMLILRTMRELRFNVAGIFGVRTAALTDAKFRKEIGSTVEFVFNSDAGLNEVGAKAKAVAAKFQKTFNRPAGVLSLYPYVSVYVLADALERARSTDRAKLRDALAQTNLADHPMVGGAIKFDETGQNINASPILVQFQHGNLVTVWPKAFATGKMIFPVPKWEER